MQKSEIPLKSAFEAKNYCTIIAQLSRLQKQVTLQHLKHDESRILNL